MTKIGVLLPTREAVIYGDKSGDPRPLVDIARQAEDAGFDSVWVGDSLLARPRSEPLTLLAGVATATSRVELGTAVLLPSLRNAEQLAQSVATVDALSSGRLILGIGTGPDTPSVRADYELVGTDFDRRASASLATVTRARSLWSGTDGVQMYPLPARPGGPPIWIAGAGPRNLERTGAYADGWFPISATPQIFSAGLQQVRAAAVAAGRRPDELTIAVYLTVVLGPKAQAERQLAEHSQLYYGLPHDVISRAQGSTAGPAEHVGEWIRSYIDAGAEHICVRIGCADVAGQIDQLAGLLDELRT